ncbi:MAG: alpha-L-fucosidase [Bryobacteraceae bacterium]
MKFITAFHHAENWFFFPVWDKRYDSSDSRYSGLYGQIHGKDALPDKRFLDRWEGKVVEVIDKYGPDLIWFDFGLLLVHENYKEHLFAYYFNKRQKRERRSRSHTSIMTCRPGLDSTIRNWVRSAN